MEKIVEKIQEILQRSSLSSSSQIQPIYPLLSKERYGALPYSEKNIHPITDQNISSSVAFIDAGQAVLIETPSFCLAFIRTHAVVYNDKKRMSSKTNEAYLLITSSTSRNFDTNEQEISYQVEFMPIKGSFSFESLLSFDSLDQTIRTGNRRYAPSVLVGIARRFSELSLACEIIDSLSSGDMVVLDGSLQQSYTNEQHLLQALNLLSQRKNIFVMGLSKTNSLFASNENHFSSVFSNQTGEWYYAPLATPLKGSPHISFAKFHSHSKHIFMLESFEECTSQNYATLVSYANDPVFLGYPYGLVEADRAARVSKEEANYLQTKLMEKLGNNESLRSLLSSKNAHGILDKIMF